VPTTVIGERTLSPLLAIRQAKLLPELFGRVLIARSNYEAITHPRLAECGDWLKIVETNPGIRLSSRFDICPPLEQDTLRLAVSRSASMTLLEGRTKDLAKLEGLTCEGTVSLLVQGHRKGLVSGVRPMVKALRALGHEDVLPPPEMLEALWEALDELE